MPKRVLKRLKSLPILKLKTGTRDGLLTVTAEIPDGCHTYSLTQPDGGPFPTTLKLNGTGIKLTSDFVALQEPKKYVDEFVGPLEEYQGLVRWHARVEMSPNAKPAELDAMVDLAAQLDNHLNHDSLRPTTYSGEIKFLGESNDLELPGIPRLIKLTLFEPIGTHVTLTGRVFTDDGRKNFTPGDTVTMEITAVPLQAYHFYAYHTARQQMYVPTMISIKQPPEWAITGPTVSVEPKFEIDLPIHDVPTTWSFKIKIPKSAAPEQAVAITGGITIQTCDEVGCDAPRDSRFTVTIPMGTNSAAALKFEPAAWGSVAKAVASGEFAKPIDDGYAPAQEPKPEHETVVKLVQADTPEQIAAMAKLYDVNEPINYINYSDMDQFPIGSNGSFGRPNKQTGLLLVTLFAFIGGTFISWMLFQFSGRSDPTKRTLEQNETKAAYPRLRGLALTAGLIFLICTLVTGALLILAVGQQIAIKPKQVNPSQTITWKPWHPGKVAQQLKQNKIVWVTYSADWEMTSKVNEARVSSNVELVDRINDMEISFVKVDFTSQQQDSWKELARTGSRNIPVDLIYPPNYPAEPAIKLEPMLSPKDVHRVLDRMEAIVSNRND